MTGRDLADIFEVDRLPPVLLQLEQKLDGVTGQLEALPALPNAREGTEEVYIYTSLNGIQTTNLNG